ncbi:MAG TPA: helix-turn-helix transcriptional regulator [Pseudonocardia sp.]|jgi:transcriptional regulator with XRE-family HTH domain|nr:helix-turn-helix transcriptional regulator [Pseudonocardia sp.]
MDRVELADFLRRRRERLRPRDIGLPDAGPRRTPGLRREEVAYLVGMSTDYYVRLEQQRSPQPSPQVLTALARALRLTDDERDHLFVLAGHPSPPGPRAGDHVRPGMLALLDQLEHAPAQVLTDLGDLLAQNDMAQLLFGTMCSVAPGERNVVWRWFTDPGVRARYPADEHDYYSRLHVADLRAAVARRGRDPLAAALVDRLRAASPEFTALWDQHEVAVRRRSRMRINHPALGPIELDSELLLTPAEDQQFLVFTPPPGSITADQLAQLRAATTPATPHPAPTPASR